MAAIIYLPFLQKTFDSAVIPTRFLPGLLLFALILYTIEWLRKSLVRRLGKARENHSPDSARGGKE
jgi:hypothetical protein